MVNKGNHLQMAQRFRLVKVLIYPDICMYTMYSGMEWVHMVELSLASFRWSFGPKGDLGDLSSMNEV